MKFYLVDHMDATDHSPLLRPGPWGTFFAEMGLSWSHVLFKDEVHQQASQYVLFVHDWDTMVVIDQTGEYGSSFEYARLVRRDARKNTLVIYGLPQIGRYNMNLLDMPRYYNYAADDEVYQLFQCSTSGRIELIKLARPANPENVERAGCVCHWTGALYPKPKTAVSNTGQIGFPSVTEQLRAALNKGMEVYYAEMEA